ncbi:unnamed protein product [Ectocarpus sp. 8 AP-2014]
MMPHWTLRRASQHCRRRCECRRKPCNRCVRNPLPLLRCHDLWSLYTSSSSACYPSCYPIELRPGQAGGKSRKRQGYGPPVDTEETATTDSGVWRSHAFRQR